MTHRSFARTIVLDALAAFLFCAFVVAAHAAFVTLPAKLPGIVVAGLASVAAVLVIAAAAFVWVRFCRWLDGPLSDQDIYCARVDRELDDELAARQATRPHGNVVPFPERRDA